MRETATGASVPISVDQKLAFLRGGGWVATRAVERVRPTGDLERRRGVDFLTLKRVLDESLGSVAQAEHVPNALEQQAGMAGKSPGQVGQERRVTLVEVPRRQ